MFCLLPSSGWGNRSPQCAFNQRLMTTREVSSPRISCIFQYVNMVLKCCNWIVLPFKNNSSDKAGQEKHFWKVFQTLNWAVWRGSSCSDLLCLSIQLLLSFLGSSKTRKGNNLIMTDFNLILEMNIHLWNYIICHLQSVLEPFNMRSSCQRGLWNLWPMESPIFRQTKQ